MKVEIESALEAYADRFQENFPIMIFRGCTEKELIQIIRGCIEAGSPFSDPEVDNPSVVY